VSSPPPHFAYDPASGERKNETVNMQPKTRQEPQKYFQERNKHTEAVLHAKGSRSESEEKKREDQTGKTIYQENKQTSKQT
jgi:hypothetical protein